MSDWPSLDDGVTDLELAQEIREAQALIERLLGQIEQLQTIQELRGTALELQGVVGGVWLALAGYR